MCEVCEAARLVQEQRRVSYTLAPRELGAVLAMEILLEGVITKEPSRWYDPARKPGLEEFESGLKMILALINCATLKQCL